MFNCIKRDRMAIYIHSIRNFFANYFNKPNIEQDKTGKLEAYLSIIYKLLIWEDPFLSGVALSVAHVLFWTVIHFEIRLYGIFFISLLVLFGFDLIFDNTITTKIDRELPIQNIKKTIKFFSAFLYYMATLRKEHPGTFCICMCTTFLILSIVGRMLSGLILSYLGLISVLLIPGIIYRLPTEVLNILRHTFHVISTDDGVLEENELLPNQDAILEEKDGDADSLKTDYTADSCTSFITGVTAMPSYLDAEGSLDGLDEEDLEITRHIRDGTPSNFSNDSSDNEHKDIKFEASHFNGDSSSDEERNYEKGLTFTELDTIDKPHNKSKNSVSFTQQLSSSILNNIGNMGTSLVSTVIKTAVTNQTLPPTTTNTIHKNKNDSDSDFEIIDTDDIQSDET